MPELRRGPVVLRAFRDSDAPMVQGAARDPLIPKITTVPTSGSRDDALAYIARQHGRLRDGEGYSFVIADAATDEPMGQIGLWLSEIHAGRATTGYWLAPGFRGRGLGRAALGALTDWAGGLTEVRRLHLYVEPWNEPSWRAAEACGFRREGLLRSWQRVGEARRDMYVYAVVADGPVTGAGTPQVIVLNGGSSSGKSSLARALQSTLAGAWLRFTIDDLIDACPPLLLTAEGIDIAADGSIAVGAGFRDAERAWMDGVAAMARAGAHLIVEDGFLSGEAAQRRWADALSGLDVAWVGVRLDAALAAEREAARGDRQAGMAALQADSVHEGVRYDATVDSATGTPEQLARRLALDLGLPARPPD